MNRIVHFKIYRLCRDQNTINRLEEAGKKYGLPVSILVTGPDYFTFIEDIIENCHDDYALLCHDDVVIPIDIEQRVDECIRKVNKYCGSGNWGVVGNAGVEAISFKIVRFLKDRHSSVIPNKSLPIPVVSVDGNVMLFNIKNMRRNKVELPSMIRGFHQYDFITLVECYKKNLLVLVDSALYVYHKSGGSKKDFDEFSGGEKFQNYWSSMFVNHIIFTINGQVEIKSPHYNHLRQGNNDHRTDFYSLVKNLILSINTERVKPVINIITRTQLRNANALRRLIESVQLSQIANHSNLDFRLIVSVNNVISTNPEEIIHNLKNSFKDLEIKFVKNGPSNTMAPRVQAVYDAIKEIPLENNQFVWIIDDDDFIFPKDLMLLPFYLNEEVIFIGNSESFDEDWSSDLPFPNKSLAKPVFYSEVVYAKNYLGDNHVPTCSVILPVKAISDVFANHKLAGDYYEDYAFLFLAQIKYNILYLPVVIAGVSHHSKNTIFENDRTHWDYSFITFMTEIVNSGSVNNSQYELNSLLYYYEKNYGSLRFLLSLFFNKAKLLASLTFRLKIKTVLNILRKHL